ncbi:MAG: M28 family peptidase [Deltaproteobacteria bacterium]|nr:M28 family peptidase [Deltaproteobacteria bacterium]
MVEMGRVQEKLRRHVEQLTVRIGERSVRFPKSLASARDYVRQVYEDAGIPVQLRHYEWDGMEVANVIGRIELSASPTLHYVVGAHYDSLEGTVGADDNASAIAVQLELARRLASLQGAERADLALTFVSFALEEPPVFMTEGMGSRIHAADAKRGGVRIDGMVCLEMVGYTCHEPGCQSYPFPLMFLNYPKRGDFIGIVGNLASRGLTHGLLHAFRQKASLPAVALAVPFNGWLLPSVRLSDHVSFWDHGYPAVMITDSAFYRNPYYHTRGDTMEKLDYAFMERVVDGLAHFFLTSRR